jgi:hypothetical protein
VVSPFAARDVIGVAVLYDRAIFRDCGPVAVFGACVASRMVPAHAVPALMGNGTNARVVDECGRRGPGRTPARLAAPCKEVEEVIVVLQYKALLCCVRVDFGRPCLAITGLRWEGDRHREHVAVWRQGTLEPELVVRHLPEPGIRRSGLAEHLCEERVGGDVLGGVLEIDDDRPELVGAEKLVEAVLEGRRIVVTSVVICRIIVA